MESSARIQFTTQKAEGYVMKGPERFAAEFWSSQIPS